MPGGSTGTESKRHLRHIPYRGSALILGISVVLRPLNVDHESATCKLTRTDSGAKILGVPGDQGLTGASSCPFAARHMTAEEGTRTAGAHAKTGPTFLGISLHVLRAEFPDDVTPCYASFLAKFRTAYSSCKIIEFM